ncbi:T9SS type A sorting domain-containing protein [Marinoscillum sp. MHG1-6]|uniref:T9SS type A sorting domain-containing protein n=1 Tax=Marinoscillum sp. MHG1-6 TaxID=2959627 RepID=UPI0021571FFE|nr:T9SS type A sorting domain-containing protein [Marinoscillum sp. MHG1-6]
MNSFFTRTLFFTLALVLVVLSYGQTVEINGTGYGSISAAITAATNGDVIDITGIHTETISISDKSITLRGTDPATDIIQAAETAGTASGRVITIADPLETINVTIENLGIRYGKATENGGGISVDKILGKLTLNNLIIEQNSTDKNGGGFSAAGSDVDIIECSIINNTSSLDGGGIILAPNNGVATDSDVKFFRSLVDGNIGRNGGGIYINGNKGFGDNNQISVYLENTTISNNTSSSGTSGNGGGAIWSKSVLWLGDNTSGNVTLQLVHSTLYKNVHSSALKNGIQFTGVDGSLNNFSIYNSIVVSADDIAEKALNFANTNTTAAINNIFGGLENVPTLVNDEANNNSTGKTATFIGIASTLSDEGGNVQVFPLVKGASAIDYCTVSTGITLPTTDAVGTNRDGSPDAGATEYVPNNPPVVESTLGDLVFDVGFTSHEVDITGLFSDPDGDPLTIDVDVENTNVVSANLSANTLTITEVGTGTTLITVIAYDEEDTVSESFSVTVGTNNAPTVVNAISDKEFQEGFSSSTIDLSSTFSDADGDTITLVVEVADETVLTASLDSTSLTLTEVALGSTTVTVTASDGNGGSVSETFNVVINPIPLALNSKQLDLKVYPNPTISEINISVDATMRLEAVSVLDLNGRKWVLPMQFSRNQTQVDVSSLRTGKYFLVMQIDGNVTVRPFIKK